MFKILMALIMGGKNLTTIRNITKEDGAGPK